MGAPNKSGNIMSRCMLKLHTMQGILKIGKDANIGDVLRVVAGTVEVREDIRMGQKKLLKEINKSVRLTLPRSKKLEAEDKAFLLLQCTLGRLAVDDPTLSRERAKMADQAGRVLRACTDHALNVSGGKALLSAVTLCRNLHQGVWDDPTYASELHQLQDLSNSPGLVQKLCDASIRTIKQAAEANPALLDSAAGRRPPFGNKVVSNSRRLLERSLSFSVVTLNNTQGQQTIRVDLVPSYPSLLISSTHSSSSNESHQQLSYTLIAFTKQPRHLLSSPAKDDISQMRVTASGEGASLHNQQRPLHGVHLFRKLSAPCSIDIPSSAMMAVRASSKLYVSLVATVAGFDQHTVFTLDGRQPTSPMSSDAPLERKSEVASSCTSSSSFAYDADGSPGSEGPKRSNARSKKQAAAKPAAAEPATTTVASKKSKPKQVPDGNEGKEVDPNIFETFKFRPSPLATEEPMSHCAIQNNPFLVSSSPYALSSAASDPMFHDSTEHENSDEAIPKKPVVGNFKSHGSTAANPKKRAVVEISGPKSPTAIGFDRKTKVGTRGIRDNTSDHLSTLRRKATESKLLQNCKSSRLRDSNAPLRGPLSTAQGHHDYEHGRLKQNRRQHDSQDRRRDAQAFRHNQQWSSEISSALVGTKKAPETAAARSSTPQLHTGYLHRHPSASGQSETLLSNRTSNGSSSSRSRSNELPVRPHISSNGGQNWNGRTGWRASSGVAPEQSNKWQLQIEPMQRDLASFGQSGPGAIQSKGAPQKIRKSTSPQQQVWPANLSDSQGRYDGYQLPRKKQLLDDQLLRDSSNNNSAPQNFVMPAPGQRRSGIEQQAQERLSPSTISAPQANKRRPDQSPRAKLNFDVFF